MKTIKTKNATGTLGKMVSEVNPVQLAKMRNRMLIAAKIADANIGTRGTHNFTIDTLVSIEHALGAPIIQVAIDNYQRNGGK